MKLDKEPRLAGASSAVIDWARKVAQIVNALVDGLSGAVMKTGDKMTGNLVIEKIDPVLVLNALPTSTSVTVNFRRNGQEWWVLDAYSPDNDFYIDRYVAGVYGSSPLRIANSDGTVTIDGQLATTSSVVSGTGWRCRAGTAGGTSNIFNLYWVGGAMQLWVDATNVGTISLTSDERVKKQIKALAANRAAYLLIRPISFRYRDISVFEDIEGDEGELWGFSAQNLLASGFRKAVQGTPDAVLADGTPQPMSVSDRPILAQTVLLVQELIHTTEAQSQLIADLRAELDILKGA